jgi:glycosyltransferase involved in cell wall biosynthesis
MDTISILIPTYKRPELIMEALHSCLEQDYPSYEIIIGDDSPDDFTKIAVQALQAKYKQPITYIHNKPSLGQVDNVNMLIDRASGSKLMLLHDDDLLVTSALKNLSSCFEKDSSISVAYGKQYIISNEGVIDEKGTKEFNRDFYRTSDYEGCRLTSLEAGLVQQFPNNAFLIDAQLAKQIRYKQVGDACDYDFGLRISQTGKKLFFLDCYTAKYRLSNVSVSLSQRNNAALTAYLMASALSIPPKSIPIRDKWLKDRAGVAIGNALANEDIKSALSIYFSRHHLSQAITLGGIKRLSLIILLAFKSLATKHG